MYDSEIGAFIIFSLPAGVSATIVPGAPSKLRIEAVSQNSVEECNDRILSVAELIHKELLDAGAR